MSQKRRSRSRDRYGLTSGVCGARVHSSAAEEQRNPLLSSHKDDRMRRASTSQWLALTAIVGEIVACFALWANEPEGNTAQDDDLCNGRRVAVRLGMDLTKAVIISLLLTKISHVNLPVPLL